MAPLAPSAFISYSREDSEFALRLAQDLKDAGASVWIDQLDIAPGQPWDNAIEDALIASPRMLLVLSPGSSRSTNVRNEISFALEQGKIVIPVLYQDCIVPLQLQRNNRIDFRADYARGLASLLTHLQVKQPNPAVLEKAAEGDAQRQAAWHARELEAQRLKELEARKQQEESERLALEAAALRKQQAADRQAQEEAAHAAKLEAARKAQQEAAQAARERITLESEARQRRVVAEGEVLRDSQRSVDRWARQDNRFQAGKSAAPIRGGSAERPASPAFVWAAIFVVIVLRIWGFLLVYEYWNLLSRLLWAINLVLFVTILVRLMMARTRPTLAGPVQKLAAGLGLLSLIQIVEAMTNVWEMLNFQKAASSWLAYSSIALYGPGLVLADITFAAVIWKRHHKGFSRWGSALAALLCLLQPLLMVLLSRDYSLFSEMPVFWEVLPVIQAAFFLGFPRVFRDLGEGDL